MIAAPSAAPSTPTVASLAAPAASPAGTTTFDAVLAALAPIVAPADQSLPAALASLPAAPSVVPPDSGAVAVEAGLLPPTDDAVSEDAETGAREADRATDESGLLAVPATMTFVPSPPTPVSPTPEAPQVDAPPIAAAATLHETRAPRPTGPAAPAAAGMQETDQSVAMSLDPRRGDEKVGVVARPAGPSIELSLTAPVIDFPPPSATARTALSVPLTPARDRTAYSVAVAPAAFDASPLPEAATAPVPVARPAERDAAAAVRDTIAPPIAGPIAPARPVLHEGATSAAAAVAAPDLDQPVSATQGAGGAASDAAPAIRALPDGRVLTMDGAVMVPPPPAAVAPPAAAAPRAAMATRPAPVDDVAAITGLDLDALFPLKDDAPLDVSFPGSGDRVAVTDPLALTGLAFALPSPATDPVAASRPLPAAGEIGIEHHLEVAHDGAWLDRLARDIALSADRDSHMRFQLNPERLGALTVDISGGGDGATVRFTADSEAARALIADAQPRLVAEARAQGARIADTQVDLSGGQAGGQAGAQAGGQGANPFAQAQQQHNGGGGQRAPRIDRAGASRFAPAAPAVDRAERYA